jgi:hypothetical protein
MSDNNTFDETRMIGDHEFVVYREEGKIIGGGFSLDNFKNTGLQSPIFTVNNQEGGGSDKLDDNLSRLYGNLVVPGWIYAHENSQSKYHGNNPLDVDHIDDSLHDSLLKLMEPPSKKNRRNTKRKKQDKKKTLSRKNK